MTHPLFQEQMARLRTEFGAKAFTPGREQIIAKACKNLPDANFIRIVDHMLTTQRYAPLPKDFAEAAMRERHHIGYDDIDRRELPAIPIKCPWCVDGGVVEVMQKHTGEEYFARCGCSAGRDSMHQALEQFTWTGYRADEFLLHKMQGERAKRWKPAKFDAEKAHASLEHMRNVWREKMRKSKVLWGEQDNNGGVA
jgi:hypothetical protein